MKAILMSIKPEWLAKILNGEKTIEIRKTKPNCELPIDMYLYCTKGKYGICFSKDPEDVWWSQYKDKNRVWYVNGGKVRQWLKRREVNGKIVGKFTLEKVETLEFANEIPNGKLDEMKRLYIDGFVSCEPFYNGKISTVKNSCLSQKQLLDYGNFKMIYAWHISNLQTFETPKELSDFYRICNDSDCYKCDLCQYDSNFHKNICIAVKDFKFVEIKRAPQSWQYIDVQDV